MFTVVHNWSYGFHWGPRRSSEVTINQFVKAALKDVEQLVRVARKQLLVKVNYELLHLVWNVKVRLHSVSQSAGKQACATSLPTYSLQIRILTVRRAHGRSRAGRIAWGT